jgi:hypothetical protein
VLGSARQVLLSMTAHPSVAAIFQSPDDQPARAWLGRTAAIGFNADLCTLRSLAVLGLLIFSSAHTG